MCAHIMTDCREDIACSKKSSSWPFLLVDTIAFTRGRVAGANATEYGLTAGIFSKDRTSGALLRFYCSSACVMRIGAAVQRRGVAGVQPFGGWKRAEFWKRSGGLLPPLFVREQSERERKRHRRAMQCSDVCKTLLQ